MRESPFGKPGALTVYTTAQREKFGSKVDYAASPTSYTADYYAIKSCKEKLAPFDTSAARLHLTPNEHSGPGPAAYFPSKLRSNGFATMSGTKRFSECLEATPGPDHVGDPWERKSLRTYHENNTMLPRINYFKYVSNNVPSVFHPLEIRCFVKGGDHRMYPWRYPKRTEKIPGPIYNTFQIYTSQTHKPPIVDFVSGSDRGELFPKRPGPGAADYMTGLLLEGKVGFFGSKSVINPCRSALRYPETHMQIQRKYPGPFETGVARDLDKPSAKACTAPFKSTSAQHEFVPKSDTPSPQDHFRTDMTVEDLNCPLLLSSTTQPPSPAPFLSTAPRFAPTATECSQFPASNQYTLPSFVDNLYCRCKYSRPAFCNPDLGFLTSAPARGAQNGTQSLDDDDKCEEPPPEPICKIRRQRCKYETYPYHGAPPRFPDSPGPIYDTAPALRAIKGRSDWFNPRDWTGTGFNNSGCGRDIDLTPPDSKNNPGPIYMAPCGFPGPGGRVMTTAQRTLDTNVTWPGPGTGVHEKYGSMWRATQLGTFNTHLKGIGTIRPSAGGFHPYGPIDDLADAESGYDRSPECSQAITTPLIGNFELP